jgi:hypothetical protein
MDGLLDRLRQNCGLSGIIASGRAGAGASTIGRLYPANGSGGTKVDGEFVVDQGENRSSGKADEFLPDGLEMAAHDLGLALQGR